MKKLALIFLTLILLSGCSPGPTTPGNPGEVSGKTGAAGAAGSRDRSGMVKVTRVIDGDTFEIVNKGKEERVRLIGLDTPESVKPGSEVEPYGIEASSYTKKMIEGKYVRLELDVQERDKYGRILAYVYLEDGTLFNAKLLEEGLATVMTVPPNVRMADTFIKIQRKAREEKKGIWKE